MEKSKKFKKIKIILVILFTILFMLYMYISYRANYLQTLEIGEEYLSVFEQNNQYKIKLFAFSFIILYIVIYINNKLIKNGLKPFFEDEKKQMPKLPNKSIAFVVSTIGSTIITSVFLDKLVLFLNTTWFGVNDPVFGLDIGFYFFQKPFIQLVLNYLIVLFSLLAVYTIAYCIILFNVFLDGVDKELLLKSKLVKILKVHAFLIVLGLACKTFLNTYNIVFENFVTLKNALSTKLIGAGITDITIKLWGYRILGFVMCISMIFILKYLLDKKKTKKLLISICIVPIYLVGVFIVMLLFNVLFVNNNLFDRQKDYINKNIDYTKRAYNLNIEEVELENAEAITKNNLESNRDIIDNIRLIDEQSTLKNLNSLQTNSGYYSYRTSKLQMYNIDEKDTLVYVSPREIDVQTEASTYNNKTYEYTHGYGSIITYASKVDGTGNIEYVQKNFSTTDDKIAINQPRIYFGMQTNNTIITNLSGKAEYDYPVSSTTNTEYTYKGKAGIKTNFIDRLILSVMNKDINITFSNTSEDSKVITNRNVIERTKKIMPNLLYDENPYMIVSDLGKQIWVIDAYTVSNEYPYSQKTMIKVGDYKKEINYIRNSIKVLVDAYDGTVKFYIMDTTDPIAVAYSHAYPGVFKDGTEIEKSISNHFVYSEYLYNVQAEILEMYHNVTADVLYRGDDIWGNASYSSNSKSSSKTEITPYYTMVKEDNKNKVGLVLPYTVYGKQNITSYLVGVTDGSGNQKLKLYKFASGSNVLGPEQLDKEIEQDATISESIKSINVTGTKITKNMIIVPINNTLLYVEPIFQQQLNEKNSIPLLKKVVVASGSKVAIGDNISEALENLLSQSAVSIKVTNTDTIDDLINAIIEANKNLKDSTASNDFEMIGKDISKLRELIEQLEEMQKDNTKTKNILQNTLNKNVSE